MVASDRAREMAHILHHLLRREVSSEYSSGIHWKETSYEFKLSQVLYRQVQDWILNIETPDVRALKDDQNIGSWVFYDFQCRDRA